MCRSVALLLVAAAALLAQVPDSPKELGPSGASALLKHLIGKGNQFYSCQNAAGAYAWKLKAPDARLFDEHGAEVGRHFAGPTWELSDGSSVAGSLAASINAPDAHSIPWLLLNVKSHNGGGWMARVSAIQRLHTQGGMAPISSCSEANRDAEQPVSYQADYYFYESSGK